MLVGKVESFKFGGGDQEFNLEGQGLCPAKTTRHVATPGRTELILFRVQGVGELQAVIVPVARILLKSNIMLA